MLTIKPLALPNLLASLLICCFSFSANANNNELNYEAVGKQLRYNGKQLSDIARQIKQQARKKAPSTIKHKQQGIPKKTLIEVAHKAMRLSQFTRKLYKKSQQKTLTHSDLVQLSEKSKQLNNTLQRVAGNNRLKRPQTLSRPTMNKQKLAPLAKPHSKPALKHPSKTIRTTLEDATTPHPPTEDPRTNTDTDMLEAFSNFDQKANQLFNSLSSVLKSTQEMKNAVKRNTL